MKVSVIQIGITSFIALWLTGCSMPKEIEQNEQFTQQVIETPHLIHNVEVPSLQGQAPYTVHYVSSDNSPTPRPTVVFVHGTLVDGSLSPGIFYNLTCSKSFVLFPLTVPDGEINLS
ncbi:hypothetical protein P4S72_03525 [Vibrio sp. PP-XX7]